MTFNEDRAKSVRVAVVAAGVVSPLGVGLLDTMESLHQGRDCVSPVTRFQVGECRCHTAGQVADEALLSALPGRPGRREIHRASQMMIAVTSQIVKADPEFHPEIAIIGTTSGSMSFGENYYRALYNRQHPLSAAPLWIASYPPQKPVLDALEAAKMETASCQVIANACASGTNAIGRAFEGIRSGRYQRVLTGGYDAISELVFVGFDSLQASTPEKCRPFDKDRTGMVLGEGAAVLALEELEAAQNRGAQILAEITGYGISTDNYHLTQPDPSGAGPRAAMEEALRSARTDPAEIDYINAHGTATLFNDAAEGKAIAEIFPRKPAVSSTKGMMGHSLGAAGAIEAVICLLALQHDLLPPNINFREPDSGIDLNIVANESRPGRVRIALSNSFGFGGTNASVVMKKFPA